MARSPSSPLGMASISAISPTSRSCKRLLRSQLRWKLSPRNLSRPSRRKSRPSLKLCGGDRGRHPPQEAPNGAAARGWRLRDDEVDQAQDAASDRSAEDDRFETDPEVVRKLASRINDRLRRRPLRRGPPHCSSVSPTTSEAARSPELRTWTPGTAARALARGTPRLSCYLAASRADPVQRKTPLLRLADICIDDHDIDLAVSYLERVTRTGRLAQMTTRAH